MRLRLLPSLTALSALWLVSACTRAPAGDDTSAPKVTGDHIVFPPDSPQRSAISAVAVEPHAASSHRLAGRIVWDEDATVRVYAPVAGRVASLSANLGDRVEANAPLARLDSPDFGQVQADARKADADALLADRTLARTKDLFEHGAVARKDVEAAEDAAAGAHSEQQRAAARLALYGGPSAGTVDGAFVLRTPLAGTIVEKNVNPGQEVRPDQMLANAPQLLAPLWVVTDPSRLWVLIDTPERELATLRPGQSFDVHSAALPDRQFAGTVDWVSDSLDATTHMVTVRGRVGNPDHLLKAEMFVEVSFQTSEPPGIDVPIKAVFMKREKHFVYIEDKPGSYLRQEVQVGAEHDGKILVREGLARGQRVVTEGGLLLDEVRSDAGGTE